MINRVKVGLFFILIIVFASINHPILNLNEARSRVAKDQFPAEFTCLAKHLPGGVPVLFFSEADGILSWEKDVDGTYFQLQYVLAPRLVIVFREGKPNLEGFNWFIAHLMDKNTLNSFVSSHGLTIDKACGQEIILKRPD